MTESKIWGRRALNMAEMTEISARMMDMKETLASIASYQPRPTDIIISPAGKCGTTFLQQTFNTLRTRGDMDFDDISRVVPWIETAKSLGIEINAEQVAEPRGFKSHLSWDHVPKGAKYIVSRLEHTSRAFMLNHEDRFDDAMMREKSERLGGLPPGSDSAKVRGAGSERRQKELPDAISQEFDDIWQTDVTPPTGHSDFASLEAELRRFETSR